MYQSCLQENYRDKTGVVAAVQYEWELLKQTCHQFFLVGREECQISGVDLFWHVGQIILYAYVCDKGVFWAFWVCLNTCSAGKNFFLSCLQLFFYRCLLLCVCTPEEGSLMSFPAEERETVDVWSEFGLSIFFFSYHSWGMFQRRICDFEVKNIFFHSETSSF